MLIERRDGVTSIKRHRHDLRSDDVSTLVTLSERGRPKETLEDFVSREKEDHFTCARRQVDGVSTIFQLSRSRGHILILKLIVVVLVGTLGPKFVLGFAPLESSLSQLWVHVESTVVHLVSALIHLAIQTI
ncbi:hypothetical protein Tco_1345323 [Tanacetum coccineum]